MKKQTIGILGVGEVGFAMAKNLKSKNIILRKDLNFDEIKNNKIDFLHVCIPYGKNFVKITINQIKKNSPDLVIINSTVKPGTTEKIFKRTKVSIVHSPVMGLHPNLARDILSFTKIIGPVNKKSAELARRHFKKNGIKTVIFNTSLESEVAKLLDTAYYGWNIIFSKVVAEICQKENIEYQNVYKKLNEIYNLGYSKTKPNVIRPVLDFIKGPIGGHCVIPNAKILKSYNNSNIAKFLIDYDKSLKK